MYLVKRWRYQRKCKEIEKPKGESGTSRIKTRSLFRSWDDKVLDITMNETEFVIKGLSIVNGEIKQENNCNDGTSPECTLVIYFIGTVK